MKPVGPGSPVIARPVGRVDVALGPLTDGLAAGGLALLAAFLLILARKGKNRGARPMLAAFGAVALLLALANGLLAMGFQAQGLKLLAVLAGLAAVLLLLGRLPGWLTARPESEAIALAEEKERALGKLRVTETHLGHLVEEVREYAIIELDDQGRVASWNLGAERIKGWCAEEILGQPLTVFYAEEEVRAGKPEQDLERARTAGSFHQEALRVRKNGSHFMASIVLTAIHDDEGRVTGFTKVTHDITERWEAEARMQAQARDLEAQMAVRTAALQESEARLQGFIQHAPAAIFFKDLNGNLLLVNKRAEALLGKSLTATRGGNLGDVFPPDLLAKAREQDERVLAKREDLQTEETVPFPDGEARDFLLQKFPLLDALGRCWGLGVIATDVTEHKQSEQAHLQRQKLESLGLLAGGIAHDFNNILGAILGNLELAQLEMTPRRSGTAPTLAQEEPGHGSAGHFRIVEELVMRATTLVAQILAYAGKGKIQVQTLDLNLQVQEMTRLLRTSLSLRASLRWEPGPGLPPMEGDVAQVNQVIMNLVLNASEAVDTPGGAITIRTGQETLTQADLDRQFQGQALRPGPHLALEVTDNGPGMPPGVLARIFEPFFTTKFTGRGLGLSAVQGILRGHLGGVQVLSEEGKGTTFKVLFPTAPPESGAKTVAPPAPGPRAAEVPRGGTILVVDDEEALRAVAAAGLHRAGFGTVEARDGLEALQVFEANRDGIVLILMDLTMPRMDGEEAYRHLRRAGAMVPIVLSSGFGQEEALRRFGGKGLAGFLPKPYRQQTLLDTVMAALEGGIGVSQRGDHPHRDPVAWAPTCETGHSLIDAQHRDMLNAFNQLVAATESGGGTGEAGKALAHLIEVTVAHFRVEENLMAAVGYPDLREHQAIHARLIGQIQELAGKVSGGEIALGPNLLNFMEDWMVCHIQVEDMELARRLKAGSP